jgi:hypothetical protein
MITSEEGKETTMKTARKVIWKARQSVDAPLSADSVKAFLDAHPAVPGATPMFDMTVTFNGGRTTFMWLLAADVLRDMADPRVTAIHGIQLSAMNRENQASAIDAFYAGSSGGRKHD